MWGLNNTGQTGGTRDADIDAPEAWETFTGSPNVVVAVIDTGVDYTHPDLAANMWRNPGEVAGDGVDNDANGYVDDVYGIDTANNDSDPFDDEGHGTHVAGTIAAVGNNGDWRHGGHVELQDHGPEVPRRFRSGTTAGAIAAVNYMTMMRTLHNVNVVVSNNSWGGGGFSQACTRRSTPASRAGSCSWLPPAIPASTTT